MVIGENCHKPSKCSIAKNNACVVCCNFSSFGSIKVNTYTKTNTFGLVLLYCCPLGLSLRAGFIQAQPGVIAHVNTQALIKGGAGQWMCVSETNT